MTRSHTIDPRQADCWERYINPTSPTFANAKRSAMAAGYSEGHAIDIHELRWFKSAERRVRLRDKGEQVLEEMLDMPVTKGVYRGPDGAEVAFVVTDATLVKIKQDTAKFAVERLGKEDWSSRSELTGADGGPITTEDLRKDGNHALDQFLGQTAEHSPVA